MLSCPNIEAARTCIKNKQESVNVAYTNEGTIFTLFIGHVQKKADNAFHPFDVLLDNQATTGVLKNMRRSSTTIVINGVGCEPIYSNIIGDVEHYGTVWYSPMVPVNILPASGEEMKYEIQYHPRSDYTLIISKDPDIKHVFKKHVVDSETGCGLYICIMEPTTENIQVTVAENEAKYNKREVSFAKSARELVRRLGYPSDADMIEMLSAGALIECPVNAQDVTRANDIYGSAIATLKGKSKASTPVAAKAVQSPMRPLTNEKHYMWM